MGGFIVGGLVSLRWQPRHGLFVGTALLSLTAAFPFAMALSDHLAPLLLGAFVHGFGLEIFSVNWDLSIQQNVAEDKLARVYSFDLVGSFVARPLGLAFTGPVAAAVGFDRWLVVVGMVMGGSALLSLLFPSVQRLERADWTVGPGCSPSRTRAARVGYAGLAQGRTATRSSSGRQILTRPSLDPEVQLPGSRLGSSDDRPLRAQDLWQAGPARRRACGRSFLGSQPPASDLAPYERTPTGAHPTPRQRGAHPDPRARRARDRVCGRARPGRLRALAVPGRGAAGARGAHPRPDRHHADRGQARRRAQAARRHRHDPGPDGRPRAVPLHPPRGGRQGLRPGLRDAPGRCSSAPASRSRRRTRRSPSTRP